MTKLCLVSKVVLCNLLHREQRSALFQPQPKKFLRNIAYRSGFNPTILNYSLTGLPRSLLFARNDITPVIARSETTKQSGEYLMDCHGLKLIGRVLTQTILNYSLTCHCEEWNDEAIQSIGRVLTRQFRIIH